MYFKKESTAYFLIGFTLLLVIGTPILFLFKKGELELLINQNFNEYLGAFFKYWTHLGDGRTVVVLGIITLFIKFRFTLIIAISGIISGILAQSFKRLIFYDAPRPKAFFGDFVSLNFVEGVEVHSHHSFPSGHTATAFALAFAVAILLDKKLGSILMLFIALSVGFSRVYLMQHFYMDVYAGSIIGVISVIITLQFIKNEDKFNKNLLMLFRK